MQHARRGLSTTGLFHSEKSSINSRGRRLRRIPVLAMGITLFCVISILRYPFRLSDSADSYLFDRPCPSDFARNNAHQKGTTPALSRDLFFLCHDPAVSFLKILKPPPLRPLSGPTKSSIASTDTVNHHYRPRILCLVLTQSSSHSTRLDAILDTWGRKCDAFLAASNATDPLRHALRIESQEGYWGIWDKIMKTLQLVLLDEALASFDWILKADDDSYVIMENLQAFLSKPNMTDSSRPLIFGRNMPWPRLSELKNFIGWFETPSDKMFQRRLFAKFPDPKQRLVYAHGGPGYIMNRKYAQILTQAYFESPDSVKGRVSEDLANAVTMLYRNITPHSTMDWENGKERSHPESPRTMYNNPKWLPRVQAAIQNRGDGPECCSTTSISYHHVGYREMRLLDYQLYTCPELLRSTKEHAIPA